MKSSTKQNFVAKNLQLETTPKNTINKTTETKKNIYKEPMMVSKTTDAQEIEKSNKQPNNAYMPSTKVPKAQNRNLIINENDSQDTYVSNNNLIRGKYERHSNYQINSRTSDGTSLIQDTSFFGSFRNMLTGVGRAFNQFFGR